TPPTPPTTTASLHDALPIFKAIISEGTEQGTIEETEQEIIERVFHLSDRNITSLMTHRSDIVWFNLLDTEEMIKEKIMKEPHSRSEEHTSELQSRENLVCRL